MFCFVFFLLLFLFSFFPPEIRVWNIHGVAYVGGHLRNTRIRKTQKHKNKNKKLYTYIFSSIQTPCNMQIKLRFSFHPLLHHLTQYIRLLQCANVDVVVNLGRWFTNTKSDSRNVIQYGLRVVFLFFCSK